MILGIRILENVTDVNHFKIVGNRRIVLGETNTIYIQLIDSAQNEDGDPEGLRYIPQGTVNKVIIEFPSLNEANRFTRIATQPFSGDASIWSVDILSTDTPVSGNIIITVEEDGNKKKAVAELGLSVEDIDGIGSC